MVTSPAYRHVPTGTLAMLAQRLGRVWASPSTWYRLVRRVGWPRPRLRVHPAKPKVGIRTTRADEIWHIDTTVIRRLDGTRTYLHAVIDNFSRRMLAWRVADTCAPVNSLAVLLDASREATGADTVPVVLADAGVENVNADVDALIATGVIRRILAFTALTFSNAMIEAWWLYSAKILRGHDLARRAGLCGEFRASCGSGIGGGVSSAFGDASHRPHATR
jgi:putative transposase